MNQTIRTVLIAGVVSALTMIVMIVKHTQDVRRLEVQIQTEACERAKADVQCAEILVKVAGIKYPDYVMPQYP